MAKQSSKQKKIVGRVMHAFKKGELESGTPAAGPDRKVRNPRQAIAIALSESGSSNRQSPAENRRRLKHTEQQQEGGSRASAGPTRAELYERAKQAGIPGRSRMGKRALEKALAHA